MLIGLAAYEMPLWPKYEWITAALEALGHTVRRSRTTEELERLTQECDVVFLGHRSHAGRWVNIKHALQNRRCPVVYWWFDLISTQPGVELFHQPLFATYESVFREVDLVFTTERNLVPEFDAEGIVAEYLPESCPDGIVNAEPVAKTRDVLLWGSQIGYTQRLRDIQAVAQAGYSVGWGNAKIPQQGVEWLPLVPWRDIPAVAASARCVVSCGLRNDLDGYFSDSFLMSAASGVPVLRRQTPGLPDGPYFTYDSHEKLVELVQWCRDNPADAAELGRMGREWATSEHSIKIRAEQALQVVVSSAAVQERFDTSRMVCRSR